MPFYQNKYKVSPKINRTYKGVVYDSKKEMERAIWLERAQECGLIKDLRRQVPFVLLESFTDNTGKKQRGITYYADFVYEKDGKACVEDVKSAITKKLPVYIMKKKMFLFTYPQYEFVEFCS